jgi:hypothetical protein
MATTVEQLQAWMKSDREDEHLEFKAAKENFDWAELWRGSGRRQRRAVRNQRHAAIPGGGRLAKKPALTQNSAVSLVLVQQWFTSFWRLVLRSRNAVRFDENTIVW